MPTKTVTDAAFVYCVSVKTKQSYFWVEVYPLVARLQPYGNPPQTEAHNSSDKEQSDNSSVNSKLSLLSSSNLFDLSVAMNPATREVPLQCCDALNIAAYLSQVMQLCQAHLGRNPLWPHHKVTPPLCTPGQRPKG